MSDFASDVYTLRWPPGLFRKEVEHLIRQGERSLDQDWVDEVAFLLEHAFESQVPSETFRKIARPPPIVTRSAMIMPAHDGEPF